MADQANSYWANFVKTGNPGSVAGVARPKYDPSEPQINFTGVSPPVVRNRLDLPRLDWVEASLPK